QVQVDNFIFTLKTGKASKVVFKNQAGDNIELFHDYTFSYRTKSENRSYTVDQRPDIVLKVTKNDLKDNYVFTYLYDAKYRLQSDNDLDKPDYPPSDAINQMHRYRDAIYYLDKETPVKGKEVIGGYILFPGAGTIANIKKKGFFTSIRDVNIGAFPLVPNDTYESRVILEDHLRMILEGDSENILQDVIPQKGMTYDDTNAYVLAGFINGENQRKYFESGIAVIYHMPMYSGNTRKINTIRNLEKLKYFSPIINGVQEFYEIESVIIQSRNEVFEKNDEFGLYRNSDELYYVFKLAKRKRLANKIGMATGGNRLFRYTKLAELRKVSSINEFNKLSQENYD
ncbi:MAG: nuclease domain-containing protein, partial [Ferruginibacter sp.]